MRVAEGFLVRLMSRPRLGPSSAYTTTDSGTITARDMTPYVDVFYDELYSEKGNFVIVITVIQLDHCKLSE